MADFWRRSFRAPRASFSSKSHSAVGTTLSSRNGGVGVHDYFLANAFISRMTRQQDTRSTDPIRRAGSPEGLGNTATVGRSKTSYFDQNNARRPRPLGSTEVLAPYLPYNASLARRRRVAAAAVAATEGPDGIPLDASSRLSTLSTELPARSLKQALSIYLSLSKPRLSFLIVLTTTTAYSLCPVPALLLSTSTTSPSLAALTLLFLTPGTALASASANALNMLFEPEHDAKMSRTRNRPLVRGLVTSRATALFAALTGTVGLGLLYVGVNPTVAALGGINILLYAGVYTPLKRLSVVNTWVGALVGGIPPLMGWAAAAGQSAADSGDWRELLLSPESSGGWILASLLFAWQFPHFNALSWSIRDEYRRAGYRMLAWVNPKANARVALRYSLLLFPICFGLCWAGVTDQGFLVSSSVVNGWLVMNAWRFWRKEGGMGSARGLFWASVWHLPVVMVLAMLHKKGLWEGLWNRFTREEDEDDDPMTMPERQPSG
ncbi:MAG: Protoheme IX farnesyltransferase, mitochondrial [Lichina confinis]|nr:MAG: Protoheme IX farnesyltransferase, mitochondrial [Lichina confinis]